MSEDEFRKYGADLENRMAAGKSTMRRPRSKEELESMLNLPGAMARTEIEEE